MLSPTRFFIAGVFAGALLFAQENVVIPRIRIEGQQKIFTEAIGGNVGYRVLSAEFGVEGKTIKGAPYSATAITENTQTLSDGNRIVNKSTSFVARDSEGRTRHEQSLKMIGLGASSAENPATMVIINDPMSQMSYVLDASTKTARKTSLGHAEPGIVTAQAAPAFKQKLADEQASIKKESLGSKLIEGVNADGVRVTHTIPAGQIGNEKPITTVNETWTSQELHMIVMSKRTDPMMGESVYTLTNIQRAEPDPALFTVPSDYTITDAGLPTMINKQIFIAPKKNE
jgi:hypothetical protein